MTQFANKRFSVRQSGRSPEDCSHGWMVKGRCWYCGTTPRATIPKVLCPTCKWGQYATWEGEESTCCFCGAPIRKPTPSSPEPSE